MCGISGILKINDIVHIDSIRNMNFAQKHRGPDGEGLWINDTNKIALGHTRLAIVDENSIASQPMSYAEGRYTITFNGEIYNYKELRKTLSAKGYTFNSESDTEVLIASYAEWGENLTNQLNGMFAFAIWDNLSKKLFCARDRMGQKPFYYYFDGDTFIFASEIKGIVAAGISLQINHKMLYNYLLHGSTFNPFKLSETFYEGIFKLEAAHSIILDSENKLKIKKYWEITKTPQLQSISLEKAIEKYNALLYDSIKLRSDSELSVAACLSGGLDSSSIVCIGNKIHPKKPFKTFSARFENYIGDEGEYIEELLKTSHNLHHNIFITEKDMEDNIEKMFFYQEAPYNGPSYLSEFLVMEKVKEAKIKIILDGQGADEFIGGYKVYYETILRETLLRNPLKYFSKLITLKKYSPKSFNANLKFYLGALNPWMYRKLQKFFYKNVAGRIFTSDYTKQNNISYNKDYIYHNLYSHMYRNSFAGDLEYMLCCSDKSSMAHGVETRTPFLDYRLVEFLHTLPQDFKVRNFETKFLHREAIKGIIPEKIRTRKDKNGYFAPEKALMEGEYINSKFNNALAILKNNKIIRSDIKPNHMKHPDTYKWRIIMAAELLLFTKKQNQR